MEAGPAFDDRWNGVSIPQHHWHFHRRLYQHYRHALLPGDYQAIVRQVRNGEALFVQGLSHGRRVYRVKVRLGRRLRFVFVMARGSSLLTAYYPGKRKRRRARMAMAAAQAAPPAARAG